MVECEDRRHDKENVPPLKPIPIVHIDSDTEDSTCKVNVVEGIDSREVILIGDLDVKEKREDPDGDERAVVQCNP